MLTLTTCHPLLHHHLPSSLPRVLPLVLPLATKRLLSYTSHVHHHHPLLTKTRTTLNPNTHNNNPHLSPSLQPPSSPFTIINPQPSLPTNIQKRSLHLAPPFLLDSYLPRYLQLSEIDAAKKRSQAYAHLANCNLCPRKCGVNRYEKTGWCLIGEKVKVNVIAPHFGEGE